MGGFAAFPQVGDDFIRRFHNHAGGKISLVIGHDLGGVSGDDHGLADRVQLLPSLGYEKIIAYERFEPGAEAGPGPPPLATARILP